YAIQTRALTRNQLRPYLSVSLAAGQQSGEAYQIFLNILNVGHGAAFDILVECSIKGSNDSVRTNMIRVIQPQEERTVPLLVSKPYSMMDMPIGLYNST
ncbi:MAG: hypothetical protein WAM14_23185, partial [Candidatus Nitrosopolaris sp.]